MLHAGDGARLAVFGRNDVLDTGIDAVVTILAGSGGRITYRAGLGLTVMMTASEKKSGKASELTELERVSARQLGVDSVPPSSRLPDANEQAVIQGGHLLLSATAEAVYAAAVDEDAAAITSGIAFGLAFYRDMHWITGPLLGVKKPEWRADAGTIGMHTLNHVLFGLATAAGAKAAVNA